MKKAMQEFKSLVQEKSKNVPPEVLQTCITEDKEKKQIRSVSPAAKKIVFDKTVKNKLIEIYNLQDQVIQRANKHRFFFTISFLFC